MSDATDDRDASATDEGVSVDSIEWLADARRRLGRPPRVLHVGNIANNAYLNALFLRRAGFECHVLSNDYYDPMAVPEWEHGGRRPEWFVQGPFLACARYLEAMNGGTPLARWVAWQRLKLARRIALMTRLRIAGSRVKRVVRVFLYRTRAAVASTSSLVRFLGRKTLRTIGIAVAEPPLPAAGTEQATAAAALAQRFADLFPDRPDQLYPSALAEWLGGVDRWRAVFGAYDVVQLYATSPIHALLAEKRPYVAYEHGTLRDFTLGPSTLNQLTALAYRESDHAFVTNGDCLAYAEKIGIPRFTPMIHPVDVDQHRATPGERAEFVRRYGGDVILLCPLRHDWAIKGTDVHLRALPRIARETPGEVRLLLCRWGQQVAESEALVEELGCSELVRWLPPLDRPSLIRAMKSSDVLLDQMALPHFGATAPQGLAAGVPVVMSYRPESTAWIVDEPAPILAAYDADGVADAVRTALDPAWRAHFEPRAAAWIDRYHHPRRIVLEHARVYRELLEASP